MSQTLLELPHSRLNPLTGESIIVSPQRSDRPWQGRVEPAAPVSSVQHDPACYLCPGNTRANGERNPQYDTNFVFPNDFPALLQSTPGQSNAAYTLMKAQECRGECRVLCFSPRHDLALAQMTVAQIHSVVDLWAEQAADLAQRYRWVQIFENKGEMMGSSNPHPHGQVWASEVLPNEPSKELRCQRSWFAQQETPLLLEYAAQELSAGERLVATTTHWLAVVPWWATWPFEMLLLPRRHVLRLPDLTDIERADLAELLQSVLSRYDRLFNVPFPYSMGWHGAPNDDEVHDSWQLHAHIYPPLLRSASVKKHMVGFELLAGPQRDLTPEQASLRLREV